MDDQYSQPVGQNHGQPVGQAHRLLGNYRILHLLGQGGFADVYLGEHVHLRTRAAIKVLQVRLVESNIQSFLNEARTIAHLVHPYIIRVLDFGVEANTPFLVMDYAPKGTFRQRFLQGTPLPPTPLFPYIKQTASALQYAHDKKLIHRDVKPENMLLGPNEEVLLSDFGFALMQGSVSRSPSETAGTASYMAPEQLQGKPQPASDQYSLGVIAYEWLTGSCPFHGSFFELASQHMLAVPPPIRQRVPDLSVEVERVVMRALAKEPEQRFPNVRDFALALEQACLASNRTRSLNSALAPSPSSANNERGLPHNPEKSISRSQNAFPPALTNSNLLSEGQAAFSSQTFKQNRVQPGSSSVFTSSPQNVSDTAQPLQPDRQPFSSTSLNQAVRLDSVDRGGGRASAIPNTPAINGTAQVSSSSSQWQRGTQDINQDISIPSLKSAKTSFPASLYLSQAERITPLSRETSSTAEEGRSWQAPGNSQTFLSQEMQGLRNSQTFPAQEMRGPRNSQTFPAQEMQARGNSQTFLPQEMQGLRNSQTFPPLENENISRDSHLLNSAILNGLPPLDPDPSSQPRFTVFNDEQSPFLNPISTSTSSLKSISPPVSVPPSRENSKNNSSRIMSVFIMAMVVLIIGTTSILVALTNNQKGNTSPIIPPSQQQPVTNGHVTASAKSASATAKAVGQVAQNPYGNHDGVLVLNSPLNQQDQRMQWSSSPATCTFTAGSYHVIAGPQSQGFTMCNAAVSDYANFVYEAQMTFTKTTPTLSSGGLVFRGNGAAHQFYFFEIFTNGIYAFYRCPGTNGEGCPALSSSTLAGVGTLAAFHGGDNQPNTIAIEANGKTFTIYVNNQLVVGPITDTVTDPNYSHGMIGMMARQGNANAVTDVAFSNARIWKF